MEVACYKTKRPQPSNQDTKNHVLPQLISLFKRFIVMVIQINGNMNSFQPELTLPDVNSPLDLSFYYLVPTCDPKRDGPPFSCFSQFFTISDPTQKTVTPTSRRKPRIQRPPCFPRATALYTFRPATPCDPAANEQFSYPDLDADP